MTSTKLHVQRPDELPPNIYIVGAHSTGKTTLVTALGEHFARNPHMGGSTNPPHQLKEVARGVLVRHQFTASDITNSKERALELQRLIIEAQAAAEDALQNQNEWYIADRSALDAVAYARQYVGKVESRVLREVAEWQQLGGRMRAGVVMLCEPGGEWLIDEGVRSMPRDRDEWFALHSHVEVLLVECEIPYTVLPCSVSSLGHRIDAVLRAWKWKQQQQHHHPDSAALCG